MLRVSALFRLLGVVALIVYFVLAGVYLGLRYAVLPSIDHWRPHIASQLSSALGTQVHLDQVSARLQGLNPTVNLQGVAFYDGEGRRVLRLPSVQAELAWRDLLHGRIKFVLLQAHGLRLDVRRDTDGRFWVLGHSFDVGENGNGNGSGNDEAISLDQPLMQWLARQEQIVLDDMVIRWRDAMRTGEPLVLRKVTLNFLSDAGGHSLSLDATPPEALGRTLAIRSRFDKVDAHLPATDKAAWSGMLYTHVDGMAPRAWQPWMDVPGDLESGQVSARWWQGVERGEPDRFALDVDVKDGKWRLGDDAAILAESARLAAVGAWHGAEQIARALTLDDAPEMASVTGATGINAATASRPDHEAELSGGTSPSGAVHTGTPAAVQFAIRARNLDLRLPEQFDFPLDFDVIDLGGTVTHQRPMGLSVDLSQAHLLNDDMNLGFRGQWRQGAEGDSGSVDMHGTFARASLDAIDEYLPNTVSLDAREWLAKGLVDGQIENAAVLLRGSLDHFPFGETPEQGDFRIAGDYRDGIIDYLPAEGQEAGWPRLTDMKGKVSLHRVDLRMVADEATVWPATDQPIQLNNVRAQIPNIEYGAVLDIQGESQAQASTYLTLVRTTPLQDILGHILDDAKADGQWRVPLSLTIPLLDSLNTTVRGSIHFSGGSVAMQAQAPPFENLNGSLEFTDEGVRIDQLTGRFLGGEAVFGGGMGGREPGLSLKGRIQADALASYADLEGLQRLKGTFPYQAQLRQQSAGRVTVTVSSDLQGLAIDLPAPLGKQAASEMPLKVSWASGGTARDTVLDITANSLVRARLLRREGAKGPYFRAVGVAVDQPLETPESGIGIDVKRSSLDLDAWEAVINDFSESDGESEGARQPVFPALQRARFQADQIQVKGLELDKATLTAKRVEPLTWRVDISSTQTAGTIFWREASGRIAGHVDAKFDRLALGRKDAAESDAPEGEPALASEYLDIPAIKLAVEKFVLYGHPVGRLAVEGVNLQRGQLWRLDKLSLSGRTAQLNGTGQWRLSGTDRGLTLDAVAEIEDAGAYLTDIGFPDRLEGGKGTIKGKIEWRNMPWALKRSDIDGKIEVELDKGRFSAVHSRSARILELLSLQSLRRLATFDFSPGSAFKDGFPFDRLTGTLSINDGIMTTNNYRVTGPVATISLGGDADLVTETLDMQAMVVPNLDISGASVAAGIAINPIVGVGAFLTQWLLRKPLASAMTVHYQVSGAWDDPKLEEVPVSDTAGSTASASDTTVPKTPAQGGQ